ncbi:CDP-2,3-bis-(O-geranylgeranyl)-sn-glycerol synthase [Candidatus Bathyarchaeota archaeon]|nr:CDP-2,3-bis-(O-geranylgeranyl)-sn-glycerol synthase [Candidatus Bathyarchaeota archaeon]
MELAQLVIEAMKFIFPAYCANAIPVIAGGGSPLDLGKNFVDGRPIFGRNKTFRGFFFGLTVGTVIGLAESALFGYHLLFGLLLSLGALLGDLAGAFLKRRLDLAPGDMLPVVDQVDFVVGALLFSLPISLVSVSYGVILTVLILTPPVHLLTNFGAYKLGLKNNPW